MQMNILEHAETHIIFRARTLWLPSSFLRMVLMLIKKVKYFFLNSKGFVVSFMHAFFIQFNFHPNAP